MYKRYTFILTVIFCSRTLTLDAQNLQSSIKAQAMEMANALVSRDYKAFVQHMHPSIVAFAGGPQKLIGNMDSAGTVMKQFGIVFKKIFIGNPGQVIQYKDQLQCVVPQSTDMQSSFGEMHAETSLVAISKDQGKTWYFIDTNVYQADKLKSILPDLSPNLQIPAQKQPTFTPAQQ